MIIKTDRGQRIKTDGREPRWSDLHQRFHATGQRWIVSKRKWSTNALCHDCKSFTIETNGETS